MKIIALTALIASASAIRYHDADSIHGPEPKHTTETVTNMPWIPKKMHHEGLITKYGQDNKFDHDQKKRA